MIPGFGGLVSGVMGGVKGIGDVIRKATSKGAGGENPSLAAVEAGQKAVKLIEQQASAAANRSARKAIAGGQKKKKRKPRKNKGQKPKGGKQGGPKGGTQGAANALSAFAAAMGAGAPRRRS